jgi:hypothetical protein
VLSSNILRHRTVLLGGLAPHPIFAEQAWQPHGNHRRPAAARLRQTPPQGWPGLLWIAHRFTRARCFATTSPGRRGLTSQFERLSLASFRLSLMKSVTIVCASPRL